VRFLYRWLLLAILLTGLCAGPNQRARASAAPPPPSATQPETTQTSEARRVIVGVRVPDYQPEGALNDSAAIAEQRAAIARAQAALLARLAPHIAPHIAPHHLAHVTAFPFIPFVALQVNDEALRALRADPEVMSIEDDWPMPPTLAESGPLAGANYAWAQGYTGAGQALAILDTGVDKTHPFLSGKVIAEACYSNAGGGGGGISVCPGGVVSSTAIGSGVNCSPGISGCGHGTHVAGIAAGRGASFSGIAKDADVIAIQVFTEFTQTTFCGAQPAPCALSYTSDQIAGLQRVVELAGSVNIAAVNLSLGNGSLNPAYCDSANPSMKAAIDNLRSLGIATTISAGNNSYTTGVSFPACISSAISVGSTKDGSNGATPTDGVSTFSNSASYLNLLAPGEWINSSTPGGTFANFAGTSMAAPHVAGAWAILKQIQPTATVDSLLNLLTTTGLPVTDPRNGVTTPRLRIGRAVAQLGDHELFLPLVRRSCAIPIADSSFETFIGGDNPYWEEASTNFATPLCPSLAACQGASVYTGPRTGEAWAWFGGASLTETASLSQTISFPVSGTATVWFYLWIGAAAPGSGADDIFEVRLDDLPLFQANATQQAQYPVYTLVPVDASAFTDGGAHSLQFYAATSGQIVNFNVDDVSATCGP
jgi:subtilisin family serine protease